MNVILLRGGDAEPIKLQGFASVYNVVAANTRVMPGAFHLSTGGVRLSVNHVDHIAMASTRAGSLRVWDTPQGPTFEADLYQESTGLWLRRFAACGVECSYLGNEEQRIADDGVIEITSVTLEEISICEQGWFPAPCWTTETDPHDLSPHAKALWHEFGRATHKPLPSHFDIQRRQRVAAHRRQSASDALRPSDPLFAGMDRRFVNAMCDLSKSQRYVASLLGRQR